MFAHDPDRSPAARFGSVSATIRSRTPRTFAHAARCICPIIPSPITPTFVMTITPIRCSMCRLAAMMSARRLSPASRSITMLPV
jgi:hypothetical protein